MTWVPRIDVDSFQSVKKKQGRQQKSKSRKLNLDETNLADETHSQNSSISSTTTSKHLTQHPMPTTIEIEDSVLLKNKLAAIAEIEETTKRGRLLLDNALVNKTEAIVNLQKDYDAILTDWD